MWCDGHEERQQYHQRPNAEPGGARHSQARDAAARTFATHAIHATPESFSGIGRAHLVQRVAQAIRTVSAPA